MKILRGYRYRLAPTPEQTQRLEAWQNSLRFLWNLALEQYRNANRLCKVDRSRVGWPSFVRQCKELTELRAELPWLADVPSCLCQQVLKDLEQAWKRCWESGGKVGAPRFKSGKRGDPVAMRVPSGDSYEVIPAPADNDTKRRGRERIGHIDFPKIGRIEGVFYRTPLGAPRSACLVREHGEWWAVVLTEREVPDPVPSTKPVVALDRGVVNLIADSDGRVVVNPRLVEQAKQRVTKAQRAMARKERGSKNSQKARVRVARLQRRVSRQRDQILHTESKHYAENHGAVVLEELKVRQMTKSAKGTVEEPGTNVAAKAGLNRAILDAGWSRFATLLDYKLIERGGKLVRVNPAYSSQTCAACGVVDAESRRSQSEFHCVSCGHRDNADLNAARVLLARGQAAIVSSTVGSTVQKPVEATRKRGLRSRKGTA